MKLLLSQVCNFVQVQVQFSGSLMSNSLQPHGLQHTRPPCPSPTPRVYSNSCPLNWWCHAPSVVPFSCLQSFPASVYFQMSQLFTSGGKSIGISASTSILLKNTQDWSPLEWTGWISLQAKGLSKVSPTPQFKNINFWSSAFFLVQLSHPYMTTGKIIALIRWTFVAK